MPSGGPRSILREIVLFDHHHFTEIQHEVGRISQSLLSARLRTLETAGVIERRPNRLGRGWEYHPTRAGRELETVLNELGIWAQHWVELRQEDCDPAYLVQTVHAVLRIDRLPRTPLTVRFEFTEHPKIYWLVLGGEQPELCFYDPGRDAELVVTADEQALGGVLLGRLPFAEAVRRGEIRFDGPPSLAVTRGGLFRRAVPGSRVAIGLGNGRSCDSFGIALAARGGRAGAMHLARARTRPLSRTTATVTTSVGSRSCARSWGLAGGS